MAETRPAKTKRIRASKPKVKSGCITCKVRRVKCDEGKPGCLRCQKFGRECDGYAEEKSSIKATSPLPIRPRPAALSIRTPAFSVPGNEQERRYFQVFCDKTAPDLPGYFPSEFWAYTVLQQSHSEPAIRHAVVALGALTKALVDAEPSCASAGVCTPPGSSSGALTEHHEFALSQYNQAIVNLRQTLTKGKAAIRTALMTSLLFVCFENLHGDHDAASRQVRSGLGLIDQWQTQALSAGYDGSVEQHHRMDGLLGDQVFQMFARQEVHAFGFVGSEGNIDSSARMPLWENTDPEAFDIPPMFGSTVEARNCFDYLAQRCASFHKVAAPRRLASADAPCDGISEWIGLERETCISQLRAFEDALWPLLSLPRDGCSTSEYGPTILYLWNKICSVHMYASLGTNEYIWDECLPAFEDIVARSRPIVERSRVDAVYPTNVFSFEAGIVLPLHQTAMKCRDRRVRREAVSLLLSCPRREGCWDGPLLGRVDAWLMALEEQGMDGYGFVPVQSRWKVTEIKSSRQDRFVYVQAQQESYDEFGRMCPSRATKEATITW